jgi:precorrin-6B C5,15-methyltransferase / cobalt-precorrin-6B C5,C15-methyltransferase
LAGGKIHIIGIGDDGADGLTSLARRLVSEADLIIGGDHSLASLPAGGGERIEIHGNLEEIVRRLSQLGDRRAVVLASGDPLFYGTARYLCQRLGKEHFEVVPHVSSMQLAFARIKESWDDAYLANMASQDLDRVIEKVRIAEKAGLFPTEEVTPARIAEALLASHINYFTAFVCENLGSPDERVTHCELTELVGQDFSPMSVVILVRKPEMPDRPDARRGKRLFGNSDDMFLQSLPKRGLLTPAEVRAIALAEMDLGPSSIVWDVGAGSGSVAIEAAQIATQGRVFAIEMDPDDHNLIVKNAERFDVRNLTAVLGQAPEAWQDLPDPDVVFVGGSGRQVRPIVELAYGRVRVGGRLIVTVSSIENLATVREVLEKLAGEVSVWMINVARGNYQMERMTFDSLKPVFLIAAIKVK